MEDKKNFTLKLVERPSTYKLIIPPAVYRKIKEWCLYLPDKEWSGTLFYTTEGSFADGSFTAICKDIYVSDIGTGGFTEFDHKADIVAYADEHDLLDCYQALIHSHHSMAAWFSATDTHTLIKEGMSMPHFLSLIVNNSGNYVAKITRRVTLKTSEITYPTYGQKEITEENKTEVDSYLEAFSLEIEIAEDKLRTEVLQRAKEIMEEKEKVRKVAGVHFPTLFSVQDKEPGSLTPWEKDWRKDLEGPRPLTGSQESAEEEGEDCKVDIPEEVAQRTLIQLLTGSVTSGMSSSFDLDRWLAIMDKVYKNRFPVKAAFETWLDSYIEYLIWNTEWEGSDAQDPDENVRVLLSSLYDRLKHLSDMNKNVTSLTIIKETLEEIKEFAS